jgi:hypothetical protein
VPTCSKLQRNADLTKAQPAQYSLKILHPKEPPLESTSTIDIVAVHHYNEEPDSAWACVKDPKDSKDPKDPKDPTKKVGPELEDRSLMQRLRKRKDTFGDQASHGNLQKGKGEPMKPTIEKDRAPTDGLAKVPAEGELPPQAGPAKSFLEKEPSSKIVSLTDKHQPTKDSSLLGKEQVSRTRLREFTTEGELGSNDQSAKAGSTTGSLLKDQPEKGTQDRAVLKIEPPEYKAPEKPPPVNWLSDENMLPKALLDARVLQFGYPIISRPSDPDKRMRDLDLAASRLSSHLMELRKDCPNRPILFIGHDFGVVVIERALIRLAETVAEKKDAETVGEENQAEPVREKNPKQSVLESTAGIIFLATPFKGSENSGYFTMRGDWFWPKSNTSTESVYKTSLHLSKFWAAVEKRNIFLVRLNSANKFSVPDDISYLKVLGLIQRYENSRRILTAAASGDVEAVSRLIEQGVDSNVQNCGGQTALHIAIQKNQTLIAKLLLGKGGADISLQDIDGQTAIHLAAKIGSLDAIGLLLTKGADVNAKNNLGFSAIDLAEQRQDAGKEVVLRMLERGSLVQGPSGLIVPKWAKPIIPPTDTEGLYACRHFHATLTEFFLIDDKEQRNTQHPSIWDVLYGPGPESILNDGRPLYVKEQPKCRWFHIPANNVSEVSCPGRREI